MKPSYEFLPQGYLPTASIDLLNNKKQFWIVNILSLLLIPICVLPVLLQGKPFDLFEGPNWWKGLLAAALIFVYMALHEAVHGIAIKLCGAKAYYGFKVAYAYAGSDAYFSRFAYLFIALSPVVLWGVVLAVLCAVLPDEWFWVFYLIQITNISGAAGDFYCTYRILKAHPQTLVRDTGTAMTFYTPAN